MENNIVREPENQTSVLTMEYVLEQIDKIMKDIAYIREAIDSVNNVDGIAAEAIAGIVHAREKTNQQLIQLLEKMYVDLKPEKVSDEILKFREVSDAAVAWLCGL